MKLPAAERLILASASPRRRQLLDQIGVTHRVLPQSIDESVLPGESGRDYVQRIAAEKAHAAHTQLQAEGIEAAILAADTIGVDTQGVLLKPDDADAARAMLQRLSGGAHRVLTAVVLLCGGKMRRALSDTEVRFAVLGEARIDAYIDSGEWRGKAGAYGIQGRAAMFVEELHGSYSGVVGLPLFETTALLERAGIMRAGVMA